MGQAAAGQAAAADDEAAEAARRAADARVHAQLMEEQLAGRRLQEELRTYPKSSLEMGPTFVHKNYIDDPTRCDTVSKYCDPSSGSYNIFVMHVTSAGVIDWAVRAGGSADDYGYAIASDGSGGAVVTGDFTGRATFGSTTLTSSGGYDVFVAHVSSAGAIDWAVKAGGSSDAIGYGTASDGAGGGAAGGAGAQGVCHHLRHGHRAHRAPHFRGLHEVAAQHHGIVRQRSGPLAR